MQFSELLNSAPAVSSAKKMSPPVAVALTGILVLAMTFRFITPYMAIASVNFYLLLFGFTLRRRQPKLHAGIMTSAIASDLVLVLILQFQRKAVQTALAFKLSTWNQAHIFSSTAATMLYIPMLIIGYQLLKARAVPRSGAPSRQTSTQVWHRRLGFATLTFRTLGYFLMFSMLHK